MASVPDYSIIGRRIKEARMERKISQEELAELLETTPVYLSSLENAKRNIRLDYIEHIANILKVNIKDLFIERETVEKKKRPRKKKIK